MAERPIAPALKAGILTDSLGTQYRAI